MNRKRVDWRSVDGFYYLTLDAALAARASFLQRAEPGVRVRVKSYALLGYAVQAAVERR